MRRGRERTTAEQQSIRSRARPRLNGLANCAGSVYRAVARATTQTMRRLFPRMTLSERSRYTRWWIEHSGLSREELVEIAIGLGGDAPSVVVIEPTSPRRRFRGGPLASAKTEA